MSATKWETIQDFAARGLEAFWLRANTKDAPPTGWPDKATNGRVQLAKWFAPGSSRAGDNWAVRAGTQRSNLQTGETESLVILDLDRKNGKDGLRSLNEACQRAGLKLGDFDTLAVETPSGGFHFYYWSAQNIAQGVDVLGEGSGVDVRAGNGYVVGPGSTIDGKAYVVVNDAPIASMRQLASLFKGKSTTPTKNGSGKPLNGIAADRAEARAIDYLKTAPLAVQGSGGDTTTYRVAARVKDLGCDQIQTEELMSEHWNPRCNPSWNEVELAQKVEHAYRYGVEPPGIAAPEAVFTEAPAVDSDDNEQNPLGALNAEYAFLQDGAHILRETVDSKGRFALRHMAPAAFNLWFKNKPFQVGKRTVPLSEAWLEWSGRRQYEGLVFDPRGTQDPRFYNLWHGFAVEPADSPDHPMVTRFLEHSLQNVCGGDRFLHRWLIGFFAHLVQRPWEKPLVCIVFRGRKGTGKNALIERIVHLLGCHGLVVTDRRYLVSNFNTHLENCLLLTLDEAFWSGDKEGEGKLKGLITGAQHVIEPKNLTPYQVQNLTRVALVGNEKWLVPATSDERRFAVFEVGDGRIQDRRYFEELRLGLDERGGDAHLLRYLLDYDLTGIDVNKAPDTRGLAEQKDETLVGVERFWRECVDVASVGESVWSHKGVRVTKKMVFSAYEDLRKSNRYKYPHRSEKSFWGDTYKLFPEMNNPNLRLYTSRAVDLPYLEDARRRIVERLGILPEWTHEPARIEEDAPQLTTAGQLFADSDATHASIFD